MGWTGIAQRPARLAIAADQQAAITGIGAVFGVGGEAGRAVGVVGGRAAISKDQGLEERAQANEDDAGWLKHLENRSSSQLDANDPMATYDFTWIWRELGIENLRK